MEVTLAPGLVPNRLSAPVTVSRKSSASGTFRPLPESARDTRPNQADALFNSFVFVSQKVPSVTDLTGPVAALRLAAVGRSLTNRLATPNLPIFSSTEEKDRFTSERIDFIQSLKDRLDSLQGQVRSLSASGRFNTRTATVSAPDTLQVAPGPGTPFGTSRLQPLNLAAGQVLASDVLTTDALGISGRFLINGTTVAVEDTDSIFELRDKINLGEDTNGNGQLDGAEDLNENGSIDVIDVAGGGKGPGVFVIEDINGNGILENAEDRNNNNRLDGGVQNTQVKASIEGNRLLLTSLTGGASAIDLQDPNGLLLSLGFFELNAKGLPIQREVQIDFDRITPTNLNTVPQSARLEVNGEFTSSFSNQFDNALEDAQVTLNAASDTATSVTVAFEAEQAVTQIQTLFRLFNETISFLNDGLREGGLFNQDLELQSLRQELTGDPQTRIRQAQERNQNIESLLPERFNPRATGLSATHTERSTLSETFTTVTYRRLEAGERLPLQSAGDRLFQRLSEVGIRTLEDDSIEVDAVRLRQALKTNADELQDLFFNESTGVVPLLEEQLNTLLDGDFGRLDLKINRIEIEAELPEDDEQRFRRGVENQLLEENVRTLIAVA